MNTCSLSLSPTHTFQLMLLKTLLVSSLSVVEITIVRLCYLLKAVCPLLKWYLTKDVIYSPSDIIWCPTIIILSLFLRIFESELNRSSSLYLANDVSWERVQEDVKTWLVAEQPRWLCEEQKLELLGLLSPAVHVGMHMAREI